MPDTSANLSLPFLMPAQAQKHVTHNEALQALDALVQLAVVDRTTLSPPADPAEGQRHLVPDGASGWAAPAGSVALFANGAWLHFQPRDGWTCHVVAENRTLIWRDGAWRDPELSAALLGVNAVADTTNRLTVSSPASLFTHAGSGHQVKVNKAAAADTASLLFQSGFSGRAELGLAGNDDLSVKVSPDGATWAEAIRVERATAQVRMPAGLEVTGSVTGTAVMQSPLDASAGRLLTQGAYGLGSIAQPPQPADLDDPLLPTGFYRITPALTAGTFPAGIPAGTAAYLEVTRHDGGAAVMQTMARALSDTHGVWRRLRVGGVWQPWRQIAAQAILGTVSQAGGIPTGAVLESGTAPTAQLLRLADGTQICTLQVQVNVATTAVQDFALPAAMTGPGHVAVSHATAAPNAALRLANLDAVFASGSTVQLRLVAAGVSVDPGSAAERLHLLVAGRWF